MQKLYNSGVLSNDNPVALQRKVYFETSLHFARRGREGIRQLKKSSFEIKTDDQGKRYVTINYNEKSKKDKGDDKNAIIKESRIYEQLDDSQCPVRSFELYLSKLSDKGEDLFQQPKANNTHSEWYTGRPQGINTIGNFMPDISKAAGLSKVYTNHCLRATAVTVLANSGVDATDIIAVSGHKNVQSILPYRSNVSDSKRYAMSNVLASF